MTDLHVPVTAIAPAWFKAILEPTDLVAVDDLAHGKNDVFVRRSEIEISGEPSIVPEPAFAQARSALERKAAVIEHTRFCE